MKLISQLFLFSFLIIVLPLFSQQQPKKVLDHHDVISWNTIESPTISNNGHWVSWVLKPGEGDTKLQVYDGKTEQKMTFDRGQRPHFNFASNYLAFTIKPFSDSLKSQRRQKIKDFDLTKDTLGILDLKRKQLTQIPNVQSYQLPEKWSGWIAFRVAMTVPDSIKKEDREAEFDKKKEKGSTLVLRNLKDGKEYTLDGVVEYLMPKEKSGLACITKGNEDGLLPGVYHFDFKTLAFKPLFRAKGEFKNLNYDDEGSQLAFVADIDTTKASIRPWGLYHWTPEGDSAQLIAPSYANWMPNKYLISEFQKSQFSKDGTQLYFEISKEPILQDTNLLEEEIVQVEVWTSQDARLYTQQNNLAEEEKKRGYTCVYHPENGTFIPLASEDISETQIGAEGNAKKVLGYTEQAYLPRISWIGEPTYKDLYLIDNLTGEKELIAKEVRGEPKFSPSTHYVYWFSWPDSSWMAYSLEQKQVKQITTNEQVPFYDELNDRPMHPYPYEVAGWVKNDEYILIYDRYDIWKVDPNGRELPVNLTKLRSQRRTARYIKTDKEQQFLEPDERMLLHLFDHHSKEEGYAWMTLGKDMEAPIQMGPYQFTDTPLKARDANRWVLTKENFQEFPDLLYSQDLQASKKISNANPQQSDFRWGNIELYEWTDLQGEKLRGLLVKPEGFDPNKKYPTIVNFYERYTDQLHRHRAPEFHRSTINYSFYASRGYVIFNPDVPYRVGYPGESAYNAVMSGITSLMDEGFVDRENIGVQGHSWGGYQIAYLLTKTDLFKCAESGAPVVNMTSAYGGVRWRTGLSRMFQYEQTQSRIGGTLWEYPLRYLENSPLFFTDKINTPVLILHNDKDGAVPWYQGIEWFTALRRLGKPAWMLNYNNEPHWPVKFQNRKDFQKRMAQFFDHYLKEASRPSWMERGVSPLEKGILQGY